MRAPGKAGYLELCDVAHCKPAHCLIKGLQHKAMITGRVQLLTACRQALLGACTVYSPVSAPCRDLARAAVHQAQPLAGPLTSNSRLPTMSPAPTSKVVGSSLSSLLSSSCNKFRPTWQLIQPSHPHAMQALQCTQQAALAAMAGWPSLAEPLASSSGWWCCAEPMAAPRLPR